MSLFTKLGNDIASPVDAAGNRRSVDNIDFQRWMTEVERMFSAFQAGGGVIFPTFAAANASLGYGPNQMAWVFGDPVPGNNGVYRKVGASGTGSWVRMGDLPFSFIAATNAGAGTENAIVATTAIPIPVADGAALISLNITADNTGSPVAVSFNGGAALTIKTNAGNDVAAGALTAGMIVAGYKSGSNFRLLTDQASAAIVAAAEAAQAAAENARDQAIAAAATVSAPKGTVALAIADDPDVDPEYYDIAYFDTAYQSGSGAKWRKVSSNPGLVAGAAFQNANGAWYVNDEKRLRPEHFGRTGVDAAGDTAAWARLVSAANARTGTVRFRAENEYEIDGSTLQFSGLSRVNGRLTGAIFRQQAAFSKVFQFLQVGEVDIQGGHFYGYADVEIKAAQVPSEYDGASSSYNGVAAIYCYECNDVQFEKIKGTHHAGGGLVAIGTRDRVSFRRNEFEGIGPDYIDPVRDGNQGNGSDIAFMAYPSGVNGNDKGWVVDYEFVGNRAWNSAFGVLCAQGRTLKMSGNDFGPHPGQHGAYTIECDGLEIVGNTFRDCQQQGFKHQLENYAGQFIGVVWAPTTAYTAGQRIRNSNNLYVATANFTSGGSFSEINLELAPENYRNGGVISGNTFARCVQGLGMIVNSGASGPRSRNIWMEGLSIEGNKFLDCSDASVYAGRLKGASIKSNTIRGGDYGLFLQDFGGVVEGNDFSGVGLQNVLVSIAWTSAFKGNTYADPGLDGDTSTGTPISIFETDADGIPTEEASPLVVFDGETFLFTTGDAVGTNLILSTDARVKVDVWGTKGNSAKGSSVTGTLRTDRWRSFTPIIASSGGSISSTVNSARFRDVDAKTCEFTMDFTLAGTPSGVLTVTGPYAAANATAFAIREHLLTGAAFIGAFRPSNLAVIDISDASGNSAAVAGRRYLLGGVYER